MDSGNVRPLPRVAEQRDDRIRQERAIAALARHCEAAGKPIGYGRNKTYYEIDYSVWERGDTHRRLTGLVEVKGMGYPLLRENEVQVSWQKIEAGMALEASPIGAPFVVLFAAVNGLYMLRPCKVERVVRYGGRYSRTDARGETYRTNDDLEPMCFMPARTARLIETGDFFHVRAANEDAQRVARAG